MVLPTVEAAGSTRSEAAALSPTVQAVVER
jgi:hypothetical protein